MSTADADATVTGTVEAVDAADARVDIRTGADRVSVFVGPEAFVWRDRRLDLGDLRGGEEVVCEGKWRVENGFQATAIVPRYRVVEGTLIQASSDGVETSGGTFSLTERARPGDVGRVLALSRGTSIAAYCRREPVTSRLVADAIYLTG
jgi:hypothetical protein